ncbi:protein mono-ADP-ribosyltransferase PARP14-like [Xenia sp. Carnegie-2017]|uniref:protein mono-ADP-ribosyltransferase PARP14-like n=1 Tax=Xenia sp. Carnegie-2017 TaxID=2897299 RepID=UPI001F049A52|nr:protein mono-ADP-ribosyltransferase PARP14-like [Xenia sp. Carnegie-2017]
MKERLKNEFEAIKAGLKEENVEITICERSLKYSGTEKGIKEAKTRIIELKKEIRTKIIPYTLPGALKLFSSDIGQKYLNLVLKENTKVMAIVIDKHEENVEPFNVCNFTTKEGLEVSWKYGDLAKEKADVLVNSALPNLGHKTMVGQAFNEIGGNSYVEECGSHTHISYGDIATTNAGNLSCQFVIHAVCCDWTPGGNAEELFRNLLKKILEECNQRSAKSVALPMMGTGQHNFPVYAVLLMMREEFIRFSSTSPQTSLKEIRLIRYDSDGTQRQTTNNSSSSNLKPSHVPFAFGCGKEIITLQIIGRSDYEISSALQNLEKFVNENITTIKISYEKLYDLVLKLLADKLWIVPNNVRMEFEDEKTISFTGSSNEVRKESSLLKNHLSELTNDEILSIKVPPSWSPQPSDQIVNVVGLTQSSSEYIEIEDYFVARGGRSDQIYEIQRIQNPGLYSRYQTFKKSMRGDVNEMRLFHGTNSANVEAINSNNFSRSYTGINGVMYGNGVYFAGVASYSLEYSLRQCSAGSQPKMFVAKVLVGEYTSGMQGLKAPPSRNDSSNPGLLYDSVVDDVNNPTIFVIFQDSQCYPEYLITLNK